MDVKPTWIPTWHQMDHGSWSHGLFSKNHLLEVDLTQHLETMALWTLTTIDLFYVIMCEVPAWIEIHQNSIWFRARSHMTSHYTWGSVTTLHDFGVCWDGLWTHSFGLSQFHGHGPWLVVCTDQGDFWASYSVEILASVLQVQPITCWHPSVFHINLRYIP
jgi:hypothetical protein